MIVNARLYLAEKYRTYVYKVSDLTRKYRDSNFQEISKTFPSKDFSVPCIINLHYKWDGETRRSFEHSYYLWSILRFACHL